jgi:hypothetical protein
MVEEIGEAFSLYFQHIYMTSGVEGVAEVLEAISPRVAPVMNDALIKPFLPEEMQVALFQMQPLKAPRPDNFGVCFF